MEEQVAIDPHSLITEDHVKAALKADKGINAHLTSWRIEDFTQKGDNMATVVTSIFVEYSINDHEEKVSYVVKLNPCRDLPSLDVFMNDMFIKESEFFMKIAPDMSEKLIAAGLEPLRFPRCFFCSLEPGRQIMFTEDLRARGFKMSDRIKGLDKVHTLLVVKELARYHAASQVLKETLPSKNLKDKYESVKIDFLAFDEKLNPFLNILKMHMDNAANLLKAIGGYERAITWIDQNKTRVIDIFQDVGKESVFSVLCHGDCWNNNLLFRYDQMGIPVEVMLLDLQGNWTGSLTSDLNYLLHTSVDGKTRQDNIQEFLSTYHDTFSNVKKVVGAEMPFSLQELKVEYRNKHEFGMMMAMMVVPIIVTRAADLPDVETMFKEGEENMREWEEKSRSQMESNPLMKPRFLAIFDEMMTAGII